MLYSYIIYKLLFPNGKVYIGQTSQNFDYYMNQYGKYKTTGGYIFVYNMERYNAI